MAPKKGGKAEPAPADPEPEAGPPDERDDEGPGGAAFELSLGPLRGLPSELELRASLGGGGLCRELRSDKTPATATPEWVFSRARFVRDLGQPLFDDLVGRPLQVRISDMGSGAPVPVATASLSLQRLLHEQIEISEELEFAIREEYQVKWAQEADAVQPNGDSSNSRSSTPGCRQTLCALVTVRVAELVGPPEHRDSWTTLSVSVAGAFALPPRLSGLGLAGGDDVEAHQFTYSGTVLGEQISGLLARPPEQAPEAAAESVGDAGAASPTEPTEVTELTQVEWEEQQERYHLAVRFGSSGTFMRYRGADFVREFKKMLNQVGGIWFYFTPQERPSSDPKKPNPPEVKALANHFSGKAWFDLRSLLRPGNLVTAARCPLRGTGQETPGEPALESSRAFISISLKLGLCMARKQPSFGAQPDLTTLLPQREGVSKFPSPSGAADAYMEAVRRAFDKVCQDSGTTDLKGGVPGIVAALKRSGGYENLKSDLRAAVVRVCRERLRRDTSALPGSPLEGSSKAEFVADTYAYLRGAMAQVLDELRPLQEPLEPSLPKRANDTQSLGGTTRVAFAGQEDGVAGRGGCGGGGGNVPRHASQTGASGTMPRRGGEAITSTNPVTIALQESHGARRARKALSDAVDAGERHARLAFESELVGNGTRAADEARNRLVLDTFRHDPQAWIGYAKLCSRARGRQAAAEEALRQAAKLLGEGVPHSEETSREVDFMLASLLLDRGRNEEALRVFKEWHDKDFPDATTRFLLGLAHFLADEPEVAAPLLESVAKPRVWFQGLRDQEAVIHKLRALRESEAFDVVPYAACLELLLDFGLPSLVFTFIDQCGVLPEVARTKEPILLIDARALAMDRDYTGAVQRLESLLSNGEASHEAWRLAGESYYQLQDFDRALQALNQAMSFEPKPNDAAFYVRLGHVLLVKKRWKQARDAFLRSITHRPTAEAWSGVGYAEYRTDELQTCYEALCEANLLDNERPDVWAQLTLLHLKLENFDAADRCFRECLAHEPCCDELLLEVSAELSRRGRRPELAEAVARRALHARDSGQGHAALAEALALQGQSEKAVLEAQVALGLLVDQLEQRKVIFEKALKWCEELGDAPLAEALHAAQKLADKRLTEQAQLSA